MTDDKPRKISRKKLFLMRSASTKANYSHGMGGLPRKQQKAAPITLPKMPWDNEENHDKAKDRN